MSKELNILQAIEMPVGTEFKILNAGKDYENSAYSKTAIVSVSECNSKILLGDGVDEFGFNDYIAGLKFEVIQKPVSFMEALKSGKKLKVEHPLMSEIIETEIKEFDSISWILFAITNENIDVREIILNGKWYIEEE